MSTKLTYFQRLASQLYYRLHRPHYNQYMEAYKTPLFPNIVIYGRNPLTEDFINK